MRVLITGAAGFAGSHLAEHCLAQGDEVWGTCRPGQRTANLAGLLDHLTLRVGDIAKPTFMPGILSETRFDALFHLAAITFVPEAEQSPTRAYEVNLLGGIHALQAAVQLQPHLRVVLISSAEVYGQVPPERLPATEEHPFAPLNVVAAAKAGLEMAAHPFIHTQGLHVVLVRPFNHTGPRQRPDFVCSYLAQQVAQIEGGAAPMIYVGDLSRKRDFCDVRDVVRAYRLLAVHGAKGAAYNVASGKSVSVEQLLELLLQMARVKVDIRSDASRVRKGEVTDVYGSFEKIQACCGWKPELPLERTIKDLLNWHRDQRPRPAG